MRKTFWLMWTGAKYRWACAAKRPEWVRDNLVSAKLRAYDEWMNAGCPFRGLVWLTAWTVHYCLAPVRWWYK